MSFSALTETAHDLVFSRYLLPGETPEQLINRVSGGDQRFGRLMWELDFLPNSPALFNLGTNKGTSSACFKFDVNDSMLEEDGIMDVGFKAAGVLKYGGGVGYTLSALRPEGAPISTTHRVACGPVNVMHYYHVLADRLITQSGRRRAAQMAILHCDHQDIEKFITCKNEDPQALSTFNISVAATDRWMELNARPGSHLWDLIIDGAWRTGDPGLYFIDEAERHNPTPWIVSATRSPSAKASAES